MKKVLLILFVVNFTKKSNAQIVGELFTTKQYTTQEIWWSKAFNDSSKFSFFSFSRFRIDHKYSQQNEYLNYSTVNYDIGKGFSISTGGFITNQGFSPIIALNYLYINDTWLINLFPSIEIKEKSNADIFVFTQYRPKLKENLRLFTQLIANSNFNFRQHNFSENNFRLGLDYKSFQFGLGLDSRQLTFKQNNNTFTRYASNLGIFLRREF